jgi:glycosyltransferase involved in cell wall biosynthesis
MNPSSISIVIPSFNQGKYIERTLLSILKQEYDGRIEIIVSDGGSTDNTVEILNKYNPKIIWWSEKDEGYADAVKKGFARATGEIFAIQSSDDFYLQNAFNNIADTFKNNPDISLVCGRELLLNPDNSVTEGVQLLEDINPKTFLLDNWWIGITQHTTFFRRKYYEQVRGMTFPYNPASEQDLYYRMIQLCPGKNINELIGVYQFHSDQMTRVSDKWEIALLHLVEHSYFDPFYTNLARRLTDDEKQAYEDFVRLFFLDSRASKQTKEFALELKKNAPLIPEKTRKLISKHLEGPLGPRQKKAFLFSRLVMYMKYHRIFGPLYSFLYHKSKVGSDSVTDKSTNKPVYEALINWWES